MYDNGSSTHSPTSVSARAGHLGSFDPSLDFSFRDSIDAEDSVDELARALAPPKVRSRLSLDMSEFDERNGELAQRAEELDDEIEELNSRLDVMEESFIASFAKITEKRLVAEFRAQTGRNPAPIDRLELLDAIDFGALPYSGWAHAIEAAIRDSLREA